MHDDQNIPPSRHLPMSTTDNRQQQRTITYGQQEPVAQVRLLVTATLNVSSLGLTTAMQLIANYSSRRRLLHRCLSPSFRSPLIEYAYLIRCLNSCSLLLTTTAALLILNFQSKLFHANPVGVAMVPNNPCLSLPGLSALVIFRPKV